MKLILFIALIGVVLWLLRGAIARRDGRGAGLAERQEPPPEAAAPQAIIACAQCGVHLPRDEALPGQGGVFCGEAHRAAYEKEHSARP